MFWNIYHTHSIFYPKGNQYEDNVFLEKKDLPAYCLTSFSENKKRTKWSLRSSKVYLYIFLYIQLNALRDTFYKIQAGCETTHLGSISTFPSGRFMDWWLILNPSKKDSWIRPQKPKVVFWRSTWWQIPELASGSAMLITLRPIHSFWSTYWIFTLMPTWMNYWWGGAGGKGGKRGRPSSAQTTDWY